MLTLRADSVFTTVEGDDPAAQQQVHRSLLYFVEGCTRRAEYRRTTWDGLESLHLGGKFLTGLLPRVQRELRAGGYQSAVDTTALKKALQSPQEPAYGWNDSEPGPLRPYQEEAVQAALRHTRGVLWMGTGTGKTEVMAKVISELRRRTLVIVPTKDLLQQTVHRLQGRMPGLTGRRLGVVGGGQKQWGDVTVALFQSLAKNFDFYQEELNRVAVVFSDEAHHVPAETWLRTLGAIPAPYRFALSATPYTDERQVSGVRPEHRYLLRSRQLHLEGMVGPTIFQYTAREGIDAQQLTEPVIWWVTYNPTPLAISDTDWTTIQKLGIVENQERNTRIVDVARYLVQKWGKVLVNVRIVDHGKALEQALQALGVPVAYAHGGLPVGERKQILARFRAATDATVLIVTSIGDEGIDLPDISAIILAAGGRAEHNLQQRIGRGMRKAGRDRLIVVDFNDTGHYILAGHAQRRRSYYRSQNWDVKPVPWVQMVPVAV